VPVPAPLNRRHCVAAVALALILAFAGGAARAAEPTYAFADTPGKLPKTVVPVHYALDLRPDLDASLLTGSEVVDIEVREPTDRLVLNAANMTLSEAVLEDRPGDIAGIALDATAETATLTFPQPLGVGRHRLRIAFTAHINRFGRGLFAVDYPTDAGRKRMLATHLEPTGARRVFPCWDEPAFKASFAPVVTVPENFLAISNMPVAREEAATPGFKRITFAATPAMSSYLFVLAAGELERLSAPLDGVMVSVVTTAGKKAQGQYALDSAIGLLAYYNEYFGIKYPLPKLDLIAVPGGIGGAMENWGGIVFFEPRLLFDPATSPETARRGIFSIIAHEMAHQWFGDLVTMAWWDDLWLNEGFASWMDAKASDALNPRWHVWLNTGGAKQAAMREDARLTAHPIQQPIGDDREALTVFDTITYNKGRSLIRQIENYLGENAFRAGIRRYIADHAYSNATTADLWQALQAETGKPIADIAGSFTRQAGVPLILAERRCDGERQRLALRQERFVANDPAPHPELWHLPLAVGEAGAGQPAETILLGAASAEIEAGRCSAIQKLNLGDIGYYRVQYDAETAAALAHAIDRMAPADRVNLLADSWALVDAGRVAPARFFDLVDAVAADEALAVWDEIMRPLYRLDYLERGRPGRTAVQARARAWARPAFEKLGWTPHSGEDLDRAVLRIRLIRFLADMNDQTILGEAQRRFAAFEKEPASLPPGLRDVVMSCVGHAADRAIWNTLLALARRTTSTEERVRYYAALAGARDPALARETLRLVLTENLTPELAARLVFTVAGTGEHPDLAWSFVQDNYQALAAQEGPTFSDHFAADLLRNFTDRARAAELAGFAPAHATSAGRIQAARAEEGITLNADVIEHQLPTIEAWIEARGAQR
jgi:aminopeptidase N